MAGRGRGKTLPAWMTNGDTNVSASLSSTNGAPIMGQFSDARESQKADTFQAQPGSSSLEVSSMGRDHFQPQNSNGLEQFLAQGNQFQQQPPFGRDKFPMQGGPTPPQGPHPRGMPGRYDMPSSPLFAPPRPAIQVGQGSDLNPPDFKHPMQGNFNPQMASSGIALGMSGIAPMMNFPRPLPQQQPHMQQQLQLQQQPQMQLQMQQPLMQQQPQMQQLQQMQQLPQIQQQQHQYPLNQLAAQQPQLQQQQFSQSSALMGMGIGMAMGGNVPGQGAVAGHGSVVGMGAPGSYNFQQSAGVGMPAAMLAGAAGRGMPLQTAVGPLGLGLPGSFPQAMGRGLLNGALPRVPMPAPAPAAVGDPNNEVSSWSEHEAEDKRKYWYNRVTGTSTYDKPFCLKTPEERSIPPCKWKEYTAGDGKKYYSDGKESSWTVPDEFRIWKEKMDAIERKKLAATMNPTVDASKTSLFSVPTTVNNGQSADVIISNTAASSASASDSNIETSNLSGTGAGISNGSVHTVSSVSTAPNGGSSTGSRKKVVEEEDLPPPVYATQEEAVDAFKALLTDKRVSTTMKMKEVIELCQADVRYSALKTGGEKKQALAEYQTKTLKLEKEAQKNKARKSRDAFLLMLAENTVIDVRTNWRSAILVLQDDSRYKNVEDSHDREDLFNDFVSELEKKEKEDRSKHRDAALKHLSVLYDELLKKGLLSRKSSWSEERDDLLQRTKGPEYRALEDIEIKRAFQDFVGKLEKEFRDQERLKRMELQEKIDSLSASLKVFFEKLAFEGVLTWSCRWKNWIDRSELTENIIYQEIETLIGNRIKKLEGDELDKNEKIESKYPESLTSPLGNTSRNIFEAVSDDLKEKYKSDKRLIKDIMEDEGYDIKHDSILGDLIAVLHRVSGMSVEKAETERKSTDGDIDEAVSEREDKDKERDKDRDREKEKDKDRERDREKSGKGGKRDISQLLKSMFALRPKTPEQVFREIQDDCIIKHEEEMKRQKRREDKYIMLLRDFYNRSDHVGFEWEEAKKDLGKYSEYDALSRTDRKRMFHEHMKELEQLMKLKNKSLHDSMTSSEIKNGNGNDEKEMGEISSGGGGRKSDSDHRTSERSSDGKKYRDEREKGKSEFSGRERSREEGEERSKDSERGRDKEKQRDERDAEKFDSRKRDRLEGESRDLGAETEEGEENDDEGDKKSKKNRKEKSPKRDKRHKKHKKDDK